MIGFGIQSSEWLPVRLTFFVTLPLSFSLFLLFLSMYNFLLSQREVIFGTYQKILSQLCNHSLPMVKNIHSFWWLLWGMNSRLLIHWTVQRKRMTGFHIGLALGLLNTSLPLWNILSGIFIPLSLSIECFALSPCPVWSFCCSRNTLTLAIGWKVYNHLLDCFQEDHKNLSFFFYHSLQSEMHP